MTPTYGPSLVPPEDIVAQINEVLPRHPTNTIPLVWGRRLAMLLAARNEILRLRARVEELEELARASLSVLTCTCVVKEDSDHYCSDCDRYVDWNQPHRSALRAALEDKS